MAISAQIKDAFIEVGSAIRRPEQLAKRWQQQAEDAPPAAVFGVLLAVAALGVAAYGMTMQMHHGAQAMLSGAFFTPLAAGLAWCIAFPSLYIIGQILGSRLSFATTALAAIITISFGASAMLASVPINWFFGLALPWTATRIAVNVVVFGGVGVCMCDVFLRVMRAVEPDRHHIFAYLWLMLLSVIGLELYSLFGIFDL